MTPKKRAQDMSDMSQVQLSFFLCLFYFTNKYLTYRMLLPSETK